MDIMPFQFQHTKFLFNERSQAIWSYTICDYGCSWMLWKENKKNKLNILSRQKLDL